MEKLKSFGRGKCSVKFIWNSAPSQRVYVEYRARTRRGINGILRRFLCSLKRINIKYKNASVEDIISKNVEYGYKWLITRCPECQVEFYNGATDSTTQLSYCFNYNFIPYATPQKEKKRKLSNDGIDNQN